MLEQAINTSSSNKGTYFETKHHIFSAEIINNYWIIPGAPDYTNMGNIASFCELKPNLRFNFVSNVIPNN